MKTIIHNKSLYIITIVFTLAVFFFINWADQYLINKVSKGIVSFELAKDFTFSQNIIKSWQPKAQLAAAFSLGIDYLFLILYTLFFILSVFKLSYSKVPAIISKLSKYFVFTFLLAGIFDAIENYLLLQILFGNQNPSLSYYAFVFASLKFILILIGILYLLVGLALKSFGKTQKVASPS